MRKFILSAFFVATGLSLFAQNLDEIQEKINKGKFDEAKEKVDKALADPKNQKNANVWYYKALVYGELGKDSSRTDMDYRVAAFDAYKKYLELDPKNIQGTLSQNAALFGLYEGYYNRGIKNFNSKNYDKAFYDFRNALAVKDFIYGKKFEINSFNFAALDTQLLNLAGSAGVLAKQEDSAISYFQLIADAKIKGEDFKDVYPILVDYYSRKKHAENKAKYLALGKELYPANPYWNQVQLEEVGDDKGKRLARLQEMSKNEPANYNLAVDYAVELFNYTYGKVKPADYDARQTELESALKNAISTNSTSPYANFIMTQHLSNQVYDMQQVYNALKGTKPEDIKKKQALNKDIAKKYEDLFAYASKAHEQYSKMENLKQAEKANYKNVTMLMVDYYKMKKQMDKAKIYEDKAKIIK